MGKQDLNTKTTIPKDLSHLEEMMKERVGLGTSFDLGVRKLKIIRKNVHLYYVNGLCDTSFITGILMFLTRLNDTERNTIRVKEIVENRIVNQSVQKVKTIDEMVDQVLSGLVAILVEGEEEAFIVDVRHYPGRQPEEPDTEKVVRGSRDGYVENIIMNTALTRRRIRDERLRFELLKIGERSKTDVAIGYIKDVANPDLVNVIRQELENINIDGLPMADKIVEEFLLKQGYTPYPLVRYTERADIASAHLLEGHVMIIVDTSPSVILTPATFFHHVQHAEEYREAAAVGTFVRWTRFIGIFISIFLLPLWYLCVKDPSLLPDQIDYIGPHKKSHIPVVVQLFLADMGIEFFRIAAIHTPTPLSTAMGLIAAVMIGEIAVEVGLFVPEVILYVSVAAIGTFTTPSYELSIANTLARMFLLIMVVLFKVPGFVIGSTVFLIYLASIRSLNTPYLWPFIPFHPKALLNVLVRRPVPGEKIRPSIVRSQDRYKQPTKSS
ncbi:spore germination protein [Bacillus smithii]|uniref:spore germination protein n=1 Tax=Bacillus smithii TaxID=1479 RepID=UPI002E211B8E|nr:spore germination protein [Bacillus smithii]MED1418972.1 spore germination protein [Bacillus smithii]MED1455228.1 spore germination protein [Bacillus smithii]MED1487854.1 spore germination protein [Bacillus smithii]